jgi:hypothetical protein
MFLALFGLGVAADAHVLDDTLPSASSFVTEPPTDPPDQYDQAYGGAVLISFILGLVGLGIPIAGTIFFITPLVEAHVPKPELELELANLDGLDSADNSEVHN